jgi:H+/gluconate symporter-like permease
MKNNDTFKAFLLPVATIGILCAPIPGSIALIIMLTLVTLALTSDQEDEKQTSKSDKKNENVERAFIMLFITIMGVLVAIFGAMIMDPIIENMEKNTSSYMLFKGASIITKIIIACIIILSIAINVHTIVKGGSNDKDDDANNA